MSTIEQVTGELSALSTEAERAQGQAGVAEAQAQEVARRGLLGGFCGGGGDGSGAGGDR